MKPNQILKQYFGYDAFRKHQLEAIEAFISGRDVFVLMPTGGGKSLCYQIPALLRDGLTVVVSPLIALMKDQVDALRANGVAAAFLNSSMNPDEQDEIVRQVERGELKLLYAAPERFNSRNGSFLTFLKKAKITGFAVDEAHCISHWGHDFRPDYMELAQLKAVFPNIPVMSLTASADKATQADIIDKLRLRNPAIFVSSFDRKNIRYEVRNSENEFEELLGFLEQQNGDSGIIYTLKRNDTETLAEELSKAGYNAIAYHAGLDNLTRAKHQDLFLKDKVPIVVATIAFGMGIDKPNVRFVVHMNMPKNIESYYQETGRAGRDGLPSTALLFFNRGDISTLSYFARIEGNEQQSEIMLNKLYQMADFCQTMECRRKFMLNYFDEAAPDECGNCDICLGNYTTEDITIITQKACSAIYRLNEQFGANIVIDFLRGSKSKKITTWMRNIKTYGVGADLSRKEWQQWFDYLIREEYIIRSSGSLPTLQLTPKAWDVLKNGKKVLARVKKVEPMKHVERKDDLFDKKLLELLREQRRLIAEKENISAYIVLSDVSLFDLARKIPQDMRELSMVTGFGRMKRAKYGNVFLDVIKDYCANKGLKSVTNPFPDRKRKSKRRRKDFSNRFDSTSSKEISYMMFKKGQNVETIAKQRSLHPGTVYGHLMEYVKTGHIKVEQMVDKKKIKPIWNVIKKNPDAYLKEFKEELGDSFTYDEIKAVKMGLFTK